MEFGERGRYQAQLRSQVIDDDIQHGPRRGRRLGLLRRCRWLRSADYADEEGDRDEDELERRPHRKRRGLGLGDVYLAVGGTFSKPIAGTDTKPNCVAVQGA